jgi:hypothetical protein
VQFHVVIAARSGVPNVRRGSDTPWHCWLIGGTREALLSLNIKRVDISAAMAELAKRRPLFHSESDLQHALAWVIQQQNEQAELRLEPRPRRGVRLDILVMLAQRRIAIEVKYLVAAFAGTVGAERFDLPDQAAHDISRHDVVKDIVRLERLLADGYADEGISITLSNDPAYWRPGTKASPIDAAFRLHEGRTLSGMLSWSAAAGTGTTHKRDEPLRLAGAYRCAWNHYGNVVTQAGRPVELRYLAIAVHEPSEAMPPPVVTQEHVAQPQPAAVPAYRSSPSHGTAREEILLAVADIVRRSGRDDFELGDVLAEMRRRGSQHSESTIRTHVTSRMCANAPNHHATTFEDLWRLDRGRYRLYRSAAEPAADFPLWSGERADPLL